MVKKITNEQKEEIFKQYLNGKSVPMLAVENQLGESTVYKIVSKCRQKTQNNYRPHELVVLQQQYARAQQIIEILQNAPCTATAPVQERLAAIELMNKDYNVNTLCCALKVAKGTYYNHVLRNKRENSVYAQRKAQFKPIIEEIFNNSKQIYGASKITAILKDRGYAICTKTVADIMHSNGMFSVRTSSKTLYLQNQKRRENLLNRKFTATCPNEVWMSDVTYFHFHNRTFYICVILDLYSRRIVAHRVSLKNSTQLTKSTFKLAYEARKPQEGLLFHSDNGSNYTSKTFTFYLHKLGVVQSFSAVKTPYDNSVCESFFANMKREELYRTRYRSEKDLRQSIDEYIKFYNFSRPHSTLRNMCPNKIEELYYLSHPKTEREAGFES